MEGVPTYGGYYGNGNRNGNGIGMLQNSHNPDWFSTFSSSFAEPTMMDVNQEARQQALRPNPKRDRFNGTFLSTIGPKDASDANMLNPLDKKRRLSPEQVQFLEKSFESDNKLEPERKMQLAQQAGLHPRQVAIWFQNRRARYRAKQIEKEFGSLKSNYEKLKLENAFLSQETETLKNEVEAWKKLWEEKHGKQTNLNPSNIEEANSSKGCIFNTESPYSLVLVDETCSGLMYDADPQNSDFSIEADSLLLALRDAPPIFSNFLNEDCDDNDSPNNANPCNLPLADDDQVILPWN